jgi:hypothetical protein
MRKKSARTASDFSRKSDIPEHVHAAGLRSAAAHSWYRLLESAFMGFPCLKNSTGILDTAWLIPASPGSCIE